MNKPISKNYELNLIQYMRLGEIVSLEILNTRVYTRIGDQYSVFGLPVSLLINWVHRS